MPHAVVQAEHRPGQQPRIGLGNDSLLHRPGEERGPDELEFAGARPGELTGLLLTRGRPVYPDESLLRDQQAVAKHLLFGQVVLVPQHTHYGGGVVGGLLGDALEVPQVRFKGLGHDHVQAMQLGLEVVVERRGPDADRRRYVGPLAVLVAVTSEQRRGDGQDVFPLAARGSSRRLWSSPSARHKLPTLSQLTCDKDDTLIRGPPTKPPRPRLTP